jgi:predicted nucleic-acid-binding protein
MIAVDTNILLRVFVADDPEQTQAALALINGRGESSMYISVIVLVEFVWTLRRFYKFDKSRIAAALEAMLSVRELVIEGHEEVLAALKYWRNGKADFSDYFLALLNNAQGAAPTYTFDRDAAEGELFELVGG